MGARSEREHAIRGRNFGDVVAWSRRGVRPSADDRFDGSIARDRTKSRIGGAADRKRVGRRLAGAADGPTPHARAARRCLGGLALGPIVGGESRRLVQHDRGAARGFARGIQHATARDETLGNANADLTYTPVTPCRLADTRVAGGALGANSSRDFKVFVTSGGFTAQGGDSGNCNVPANPPAAVVNIAAVNIAGVGNLIAFPAG